MDYDREEMKRMSGNFKSFRSMLSDYIIIEGLSKKQYKKSMKGLKKLKKKLKKGKGKKVYHKGRYLEKKRQDEESEFDYRTMNYFGE